MELSIADALSLLKDAMFVDPDYADSWHDNIACCIMDNYAAFFTDVQLGRELANKAASRIMNHCFGAETKNPIDRVKPINGSALSWLDEIVGCGGFGPPKEVGWNKCQVCGLSNHTYKNTADCAHRLQIEIDAGRIPRPDVGCDCGSCKKIQEVKKQENLPRGGFF